MLHFNPAYTVDPTEMQAETAEGQDGYLGLA
jgi:hypothetical protein